MMTREICAWDECDNVVERASTGRPRLYCSRRCSRAAERARVSRKEALTPSVLAIVELLEAMTPERREQAHDFCAFLLSGRGK
jgi:hypothetical protein